MLPIPGGIIKREIMLDWKLKNISFDGIENGVIKVILTEAAHNEFGEAEKEFEAVIQIKHKSISNDSGIAFKYQGTDKWIHLNSDVTDEEIEVVMKSLK